MKRSEFISSEHLCGQLNDLLQSPVFQYAQAIALQEMVPSDPSFNRGDLIQQAAIAGMKAKGAAEVLERIKSLTLPKVDKPPQIGGEYDEAAIEGMIAKGYTQEQAQAALKEFYTTQTQ